MAEIIGVVASGITVVGASITVADAVLNIISQVRNAPEEILFLHNDVTDTRLILSNIKENSSQNHSLQMRLALPDAGIYGDPENIAKAESLIRRIERVLRQLDATLQEVTKSKSLGRVSLHQRAWMLNRSKIRSLRNELRELKTSVAVHFSASTGTLATRSVVLLKRVLLENARTAQQGANRDNQVDAQLQVLAQQLAELTTMKEAQRQLMVLVGELNNAVVTSEERIRETITTTTTTITESTDSTLALPTPPASIASTSSGTSQTQSPEMSARTSSTTTTVSSESISRLKLEFSRFQKKGCVPECECSCHQRRRYRSPSFAQRILGEFFLGFSNLPLLSKACSDTRCTQRSPFSATITYNLPTMLLSKMVSLVCITTSQGDPAACIKVRPLSTDFSIYRAVEVNDLHGVRNMVERRSAHPGATFKGGWTPLHYAISYGRTAICRSLLAAGADPMLEDGWNQLSPLEWAWSKILGGAYEDDTQREMEELFSDRDCLEEMCLTTLHRIVLGLNASSLDIYLADHPESANLVDSRGRTALSWAAQRGMTDVVKALLLARADPNICSHKNNSPLQYAVEARTPDCIQPLLDYGALVDHCDVEGQTPLHYATGHQSDLAYYRPLIEAGADPNWKTIPKCTPLATAISEGHNEAVEYLVQNGADIDLKGHDDRPPVFFAVEYNNHAALTFLHGKGADLTGASEAWPTIAHVAAHFADVETVRLLTTFRLGLDEVECVERNGLSIPQIVDKRVHDGMEDTDAFVAAFELFLKSVKTDGGAETASGIEGDGTDVFYDAVE